jgi:hypothetical protein
MKLVWWWVRGIGLMVPITVHGLPAKLAASEAQNVALWKQLNTFAGKIQALEDELRVARLQAEARKPGGFRIHVPKEEVLPQRGARDGDGTANG